MLTEEFGVSKNVNYLWKICTKEKSVFLIYVIQNCHYTQFFIQKISVHYLITYSVGVN